MEYCILKHENKDIAIFEAEENGIGRLKISEKNKKYLPVGILDEVQLKKWIENRGIPATRQNLSKELNILKLNNTFELMLKNNGLSLTDHYWICNRREFYTWENINLYSNDFKSAYSLDLHDDIKNIAGKTNFIPSASLKGDLKKKWIIDEKGVRRLVKGNYNNICQIFKMVLIFGNMGIKLYNYFMVC